jgi:hypothetical protein
VVGPAQIIVCAHHLSQVKHRDRSTQCLRYYESQFSHKEMDKMKLNAPSQIAWIIALILGIVGILGVLGVITALSAYAFWLVVAGWALLLIATMMRRM